MRASCGMRKSGNELREAPDPIDIISWGGMIRRSPQRVEAGSLGGVCPWMKVAMLMCAGMYAAGTGEQTLGCLLLGDPVDSGNKRGGKRKTGGPRGASGE